MTATADHVQTNYEAFEKLLPQLMLTHGGEFALMRDGIIEEFYQTWEDAFRTGRKFYSDERFSVQEVINRPVDLGFFSHAIVLG